MTLLPSGSPVLPSPPAFRRSFADAWRLALANPAYRWRLLLVLFLIFGVLIPVVPGFYQWVQQRPGHRLPDPLLALLPHADVSMPLFGLMYGASVFTIAFVLRRPALLLRGFWAYLLLQAIRMAVLALVPLELPAAALPLPDPFTEMVLSTQALPITKDLFFSGHTATTALLALAVRGRWRWLLAAVCLAVGALVLVQRVHYSYDVLAAPLFAGAAYWLAGRVSRLP